MKKMFAGLIGFSNLFGSSTLVFGQERTLRPAECSPTLRAAMWVDPPTPRHEIQINTLNPGSSNARWRLVQQGQYHSILSLWSLPPPHATTSAMSVEGNVVVGNLWQQNNQQMLLLAKNVVGKIWQFHWTGEPSKSLSSECRDHGGLIIKSGENNWVWNDP